MMNKISSTIEEKMISILNGTTSGRSRVNDIFHEKITI